MDRWWLVIPERRIVRDDLPAGWGLMVAAGDALRVVVQAPKLTPEPMPKTMQASFLRASVVTSESRLGRLAALRGDCSCGADGMPTTHPCGAKCDQA